MEVVKKSSRENSWVSWRIDFIFICCMVMTLQPENFGKVYAAYGGIFVMSSLIWGYWIDKKKPDRFEIFGSIVVLIGIGIMFYFPR